MRHGEVFNPNRVLYGRLPGYGLSEDGRRMAQQAAAWIGGLERPLASLIVSPLQRAQESAQPFIDRFGLRATTDERVIEPTNVFEGKRMKRALMNPLNWRYLARPAVPSWGEPYAQVVARMDAAMTDAWVARLVYRSTWNSSSRCRSSSAFRLTPASSTCLSAWSIRADEG